MLAYCTIENGICTKCGGPQCVNCERQICKPSNKRKDRPQRRFHAPKVQVSKCPHLLEPLGESVKVLGCGCGSTRKNGLDTSVWGCGLYGRCAPLARGTHLSDEAVTQCSKCEQNQKLSNPPQPPSEIQQG